MASALLSACGGGGGGDGGGGSGGGSSNGTLTVSTNTLTFIANGPTAATPAPQKVSGTVTGVSSGTLYVTIVGTGNAIAAISPVVLVNDTTGESTVSVPPPSSLGVGTYTGVITVRACRNDPSCAGANLQGSPQTINVTYHVAALQASAASLDYTVTNAPTASDLAKQLTIAGAPAQNWTATTTAPWLTVTASGGTGTSLTASLAQSAVNDLTNGTYTGSITVTPNTAGQPLSIPVSLQIKRTQVNYVSPYVAYAGTSSNVIIRGDELSQVTIQNVMFGSTPAQSFTVVSPTEIRASVPASLPPGRYPVGLQTNFAGVRQFAELVVVNAPAFAAAALAYPDTTPKNVNALVYDAERAALAVSAAYPTAFIYFASVANAWQPAVAKPLTNHFGLALSADGKEWIAGSDKSVVHIGAQDLVTGATVLSPLFPSGTQYVTEMAVANDGTIAMFGDVSFNCGASLMLYDPRKRVFGSSGYTACRGDIGASRDGSRVLILNQFPEFSTDDVSSLDTSARKVTPTGVHLFTGAPPQLDRTGSRIILKKTRVYDGGYNYLGDLPASTDAVVLHPDGTRAYAFDHSGKLLTYDLTATPVAGVYPQLGPAVTLAGDPGPQDPGTGASYVGDVTVLMTITPDGNTVFIAGSKGVIVQPTH